MHKTIRIGRIWKVLCFLVYLFFSCHMYNSNTNSLIIVAAHLIEKRKKKKRKKKEETNKQTNKGYYVCFVSLIDLIHSLNFFFHV